MLNQKIVLEESSFTYTAFLGSLCCLYANSAFQESIYRELSAVYTLPV